MSENRPDPHNKPLDGQNFSHVSGSPVAHLPDTPPTPADHQRESFNTKIISAAIALLILLGIIAFIIFR